VAGGSPLLYMPLYEQTRQVVVGFFQAYPAAHTSLEALIASFN